MELQERFPQCYNMNCCTSPSSSFELRFNSPVAAADSWASCEVCCTSVVIMCMLSEISLVVAVCSFAATAMVALLHNFRSSGLASLSITELEAAVVASV